MPWGSGPLPAASTHSTPSGQGAGHCDVLFVTCVLPASPPHSGRTNTPIAGPGLPWAPLSTAFLCGFRVRVCLGGTVRDKLFPVL